MSETLGAALEALSAIAKIDTHALDYEVRRLRAWRVAALSHLEFAEGDRVAIRDSYDPPRAGGWGPYWECMMPGQTGTVVRFEIYPDDAHIVAVVKWDTEWAVGDKWGGEVRRYDRLKDYNGNPADRRHVYYFPPRHLRKATADDRPLPFPETADA